MTDCFFNATVGVHVKLLHGIRQRKSIS